MNSLDALSPETKQLLEEMNALAQRLHAQGQSVLFTFGRSGEASPVVVHGHPGFIAHQLTQTLAQLPDLFAAQGITLTAEQKHQLTLAQITALALQRGQSIVFALSDGQHLSVMLDQGAAAHGLLDAALTVALDRHRCLCHTCAEARPQHLQQARAALNLDDTQAVKA